MSAPTELLPPTTCDADPMEMPSAAGTSSAATSHCAKPNQGSSLPHSSRTGQELSDAQNSVAGAGTDLPADQIWDDAHGCIVGGEQATGAAGQLPVDAQGSAAAAPVSSSTTPAMEVTAPKLGTPGVVDQAGGGERGQRSYGTHAVPAALADPTLALLADVLDDLEKSRIANENRLRQLTRDEVDADGEERGFGLDESHPDVARLAGVVDGIADLEHKATLNLNRALRAHPLGPWVKAQKGIGEKQAARLLAVVSDPYWHDTHDRPRTVSELWAYCGHGDPTRKLRKGMTQAELFRLGNPVAKSRVWLIAAAVLKAQGPLVSHYYDRKEATEGREHATECKRCGPSGKPALPGSPWSDAHRHADALRILGKQVLRDLWLEAKRIHELPVGHTTGDDHGGRADGGTTGGDPGHGWRDAHLTRAGVTSEAVAS